MTWIWSIQSLASCFSTAEKYGSVQKGVPGKPSSYWGTIVELDASTQVKIPKISTLLGHSYVGLYDSMIVIVYCFVYINIYIKIIYIFNYLSIHIYMILTNIHTNVPCLSHWYPFVAEERSCSHQVGEGGSLYGDTWKEELWKEELWKEELWKEELWKEELGRYVGPPNGPSSRCPAVLCAQSTQKVSG